MRVLREYHAALGSLIHRHQGTLERFAGDGVLVLFNDPLPCPEPLLQAVRMALAMRDQVGELAAGWRAAGHELGFGVGIAQGLATLGTIGFESRLDYAAIGTVVNLAARLSDLANAGQILMTSEATGSLAGGVEAQPLGALQVKGLAQAVQIHDVQGLAGRSAEI